MKFSKWLCLGIMMALVISLAGLATASAAPKQVKLTVWGIDQPVANDPVGIWLDKKIKEFQAANPNIKIDYTYTENESYKTKVQVAMFGGAGPDVFYNWGGESEAVYSREGMLYDLTKAMGKDYWGLSKGLFASHSLDGKVYGIPLFTNVEVVWYNKEMFDKNGWTAPKTWSEYLALCEKIKAKGIIPMAMGGKEPWTILQPFMYLADRNAGAKLYKDAKAGKARFDAPEFVKAFAMLQELAKKGYLSRDVLSLAYGDANQLLTQDKAAMMSMGNWEYGALTDGAKLNPDKWSFFPFPMIEGGKGSPKAVIGASDGWSVNKKCKNPAAAVKFLKFLNSKENLTELNRMSDRLVPLATPYLAADARPQIKGIADLLAKADSLTQWWDQDLSAPMTQTVLQSLQEVLGGVKTPQEAAKAVEESRSKK